MSQTRRPSRFCCAEMVSPQPVREGKDGLPNDCRRGFEVVGCWIGLDLALGHDGGRATGFVFFVYLAIHDLHALKIFLDDFFPGEFDVLFRLSASSLAHSVDHVFFDQNTDLFGQVGAGREFRYPLADDLCLSPCRPGPCRSNSDRLNSCYDRQPCGATRTALSRSLVVLCGA